MVVEQHARIGEVLVDCNLNRWSGSEVLGSERDPLTMFEHHRGRGSSDDEQNNGDDCDCEEVWSREEHSAGGSNFRRRPSGYASTGLLHAG